MGITLTPRKAGFWGAEKTQPDEVQESNAETHTKKAIDIVARAYAAQCIYTNSFSTYFPELLRECTFLRILENWDEAVRPLTEEEKEHNKRIEEVVRAAESETEEEEDFDFSREFDYQESSPLAIEFVEIMKTRPDLITEEQKFRAFEIFPLVIEELGRLECR